MSGECAVCGGHEVVLLERRAAVPVAQNWVFESREAALACPVGSLDIRRCTACGFVWNAAFDPALAVYDDAYDNDQGFSPRFRAHLEAVAARISARLADTPAVHLIEIGCGQGRFMATVAAALGESWRSGCGFDPAWKGGCESLPAGAEMRAEYFGPAAVRPGDTRPDAAVSRHVIEHVDDPIGFLETIRRAIPEGTPLFIETPDVDWILERAAFFDFYYEHCSLFTPASLAHALDRAGFDVERVESVFEGQYLLATAVAGPARGEASPALGTSDRGYRAGRDAFLQTLAETVAGRLAGGGRVGLWGAASKGVTLSLMLAERGLPVACAIDINPRKQGKFMPMSGVPIVSPAEAWARGVSTLLVANTAYLAEIAALCAGEKLGFELVPVGLEPSDAQAAQ